MRPKTHIVQVLASSPGSRSAFTRLLSAVVLVGSAAIAMSSCSGTPAAGLVVAVETDVPLPQDVSQIELEVIGNGSVQFDNTYPVGFGQLLIPATLTLLPGSTVGEPFTVRLLAYQGKTVRMLRETITSIPTTRVAWLRMPIQWLSFGMQTGGSPTSPDMVMSTCPSGQTPDQGSCVSDTVDSSTLPVYTPGAIFGGGAGSGNGSCYGLLPCFATSSVEHVETSDCTLDDPGGDHVNVAMVTAQSGGDGECGAQGCLVPLPSGGSGWSRVNGRLRLPKGVCTHLAKRTLTALRVSTSCPSASEDAPLCGPWSSVGSSSSDAGTDADSAVTNTVVKLSPSSATLELSGAVTLTATVVGVEDLSTYSFLWTNTAKAGTITQVGGASTTGTSFCASTPSVAYAVTGTGTDTVTVQAWKGSVCGMHGGASVGEGTSTVTVAAGSCDGSQTYAAGGVAALGSATLTFRGVTYGCLYEGRLPGDGSNLYLRVTPNGGGALANLLFAYSTNVGAVRTYDLDATLDIAGTNFVACTPVALKITSVTSTPVTQIGGTFSGQLCGAGISPADVTGAFNFHN